MYEIIWIIYEKVEKVEDTSQGWVTNFVGDSGTCKIKIQLSEYKLVQPSHFSSLFSDMYFCHLSWFIDVHKYISCLTKW